jgi:STE24 endopeptidase
VAQGIVIAMFVALHVHDARGAHEPLLATPVWGPLLVLSALWTLLHAICLTSGRRMDRAGSLRAALLAQRAHAFLRVVAGVVMAWAILGGCWGEQVRAWTGDLVVVDELLILAPVIVFMLAGWWSIEPIDRRLKEAMLWRDLHVQGAFYPPLSRGGFVWHHARHSVLLVLVPLTLITAWQESLARLWPGLSDTLGVRVPAWVPEAAGWAGVLGVLVVTPAIVRVLWDTVAIGPGEVRDQARRVCDRFGVRVQGPLLWRTHGAAANAAVLGVLYPFRYMLFTDVLLERLPGPQVEGVIAHEVAHVKLRHMLWLAATLFATALGASWVLWIAEMVLKPADPRAWDTPATAGVLVAAALVFGAVSRRFERQADAFGAAHLSGDSPVVTDEAGRTMGEALAGVAVLNAIRPEQFSYRHGSIAGRIAHVRALAGMPRDRLPIDRTVRWIKVATAVVLVGSLLAYAAVELLERRP